MSQTRTKTVRAREDQWAAWTEAASGNLNRWICAALDQQVDLDKALARLDEEPVSQAPVVIHPTDFAFRPDPKPGRSRK